MAILWQVQNRAEIGKLTSRGQGLVVGTIVTCEALREYASKPRHEIPGDVIEVRFDHLTNCADWEKDCKALNDKLPVLFTIRWDKEGGKWSKGDRERMEFYTKALPLVSAVDVEFQSDLAGELAEMAKSAGKAVVLSYHNFVETPQREELMALYQKASILGTVVKISTMVNGEEDIKVLEGLLARKSHIPLCVIGMGPKATHTRIGFAQNGSCLTYGYLDQAGAPGQLSASELSKALRG